MTTKTLVREKQNVHHSISEVLCRRAEIANSYFLSRKTWWRTLEKKIYRFNEKLPRTHLYFFSVVIKRNVEKQRNPSVSPDSCCHLTRTLWTIVPPLWCFMLFTQLDYRTTITNTWKHNIRHIAESKVVGKIRIAVTDGPRLLSTCLHRYHSENIAGSLMPHSNQ